MFEPKWAQGTEESDSTEISFKFTVSMQARPLDVVVQSALRDLSACHAIALRIWCNFRRHPKGDVPDSHSPRGRGHPYKYEGGTRLIF